MVHSATILESEDEGEEADNKWARDEFFDECGCDTTLDD
jgi:hypothetical protein